MNIILLILFIIIIVLFYKNKEFFGKKKEYYDVLIISPGGGGTTYLMNYFNNYINLQTNSMYDYDTLKHISFNRLDELNNINCGKILYLFNDPLLAIESHFRRNFKDRQIKKLGDPYDIAKFLSDDDKYRYYNEVINHNKDLYGFEKQFNFYLNNNNINKDIMFIDFNSIKKYNKKLCNFLQITQNSFGKLENKLRASGYDEVPEKYKIIYNKLYKKIKKYDGFIKKNT